MRRTIKGESVGRHCSSDRNSGGRNSATSQSIASYSPPVTKKSSGSCRSTICDQNSTASSYRRCNPQPTASSCTRHRTTNSLRVCGTARPKPNSTITCAPTMNNNHISKYEYRRWGKINNLRQCAANRFGELSKNPFINFFRAYKRKHADMSLIEIAGRVAKIWNSMSDKQKVKYQFPAGYNAVPGCTSKRSGGGLRKASAGGGAVVGRRAGRGRVPAVGGRRPRVRRVHSPPPIIRERTPVDINVNEVFSDQTAPSSKSLSRSKSRSGSATASLSD